jgi:hypothetical protein
MTHRWLPLLFLAGCPSLDAAPKTTPPAPTDTAAPAGDDDDDSGDDDDDDVVPTLTGDTGVALPACVDGLFPGPLTTQGALDDAAASCGGSGGADVMVLFTAPDAGRWRFGLSNTAFDTVLSVFDGCGGAELACADTDAAEAVAVELAAGQQVIVVVDGADNGQGVYRLDATLAPDVESDCVDGLDDDVDGLTDCLDAECASEPVCVEVCDDGVDNNADGLVDCSDARCSAEAHCEAPCAVGELAGALPISFYDSTVGGGDDSAPSCQSLSSAPDRDYVFIAPVTAEYTFDTVGSSFDTVMYLLDGCGGAELACNDDGVEKQSKITTTLQAGQRVIVVVDGYVQWEGDVRVNVY